MAEAIKIKSKSKSKNKGKVKSHHSALQKEIPASLELDDTVDNHDRITKLNESEGTDVYKMTETLTGKNECSNEEVSKNHLVIESSNNIINDIAKASVIENISAVCHSEDESRNTCSEEPTNNNNTCVVSLTKLQTPSAPVVQELPPKYSYRDSSSYRELRKQIELSSYQSKPTTLYPVLPSAKSEITVKSHIVPNCLNKQQKTTNSVENIYPNLYPNYRKMHELTESQMACKEILKSNEIRPYSKEQLMNLYINSELERNDTYIKYFIENEKGVDHLELYMLILKYQKAREDFALSAKYIKEFQNKYSIERDKIWEFSAETVPKESYCMDNKKVKAIHKFIKISYNQTIHDDIKIILEKMYEEIKKNYCLHLHMKETTKLQIEFYLYSISSSSLFKDISETAPVTGYEERNCSKIDHLSIVHLKECISVLFCFQRQLTKDEEFLKETRIWLTSLVALLLRVATFEDHLFVLNHVLRCPAHVGSWASSYIQSPTLPSWLNERRNNSGLQSCLLDHTITLLATLLLPVRSRVDFLQHCKSSVMLATGCDTPQDSCWVFVDSDNEEDLEPFDLWLRWEESDIVSFFNQIPFGSMFRFLLEIEEENGIEKYIPEKYQSKSAEMLKLLSIATHLVSIFHEGFKTFCSEKYRQLTKYITRYISDSVKYICEHWECVKKINKFDPPFMRRLDVEFDEFIFRSVSCIVAAPRKEAWQFLIFPYRCVSSDMMWKLAWILFNPLENQQEMYLSVNNISLKLQDEKLKNLFQEKIDSLEFKEAYYLLSALAEMVNSRGWNEHLFVCTITLIVFEVAFTALSVREKMSKDGRDLLKSIVEKHPYVVSSILRELKIKIKDVGKASIYLFKELPLHGWKPSSEDITIISDWLLADDFPLPSFTNQLARLIISNINWGKNKEGTELMLDISIHHKVAVLIVEAYGKFIKERDNKSYIVWTYEQLASFASAVKSTVVTATATSEEGFVKWAWEMLFTLKLHCLDYVRPPYEEVLKGCVIDGIHSINQDSLVLPLNSIDDIPVNCTACYVAILLTSIGHRADLISVKGFSLLLKLIENKQYIAAISALPYVMPFFYKDFNGLVRNEIFNKCIQLLLTADIDDMSYLQKAKSLIGTESLGKVLPVMVSVIKFQIEEAKHMDASPLAATVWLKILFEILISAIKSGKLEKWKGSNQVYYLLDEITRITFIDACLRDVVFTEIKTLEKHLSIPMPEGNSLIDTLASLMPRNPQKVLLLSDLVSPKYLWLSWYAIHVELETSNIKNTWKQVLTELAVQPNLSVNDAVKKVTASLKLKMPVNCLPVYKWGEHIMKTPSTHPLLPLFCQQFFIYYFQHIPTSLGVTGIRSLGKRFFESGSLGSLKEMKARLQMARDENYKLSVNYQAELSNSDKNKIPPEEQGILMNKKEFHENLVKLYSAFTLWLDAPRLQEASLSISDLPVSYLPDRLSCVLSLDSEPWYPLVDIEKLQEDLDKQLNSWHCYKKSSEKYLNLEAENKKESPEQHILKRLKSYNIPKLPPSIKRFEPPFKQVNENFYNYEVVKCLIDKDLQILRENIVWFLKQISKARTLDETYHNDLMHLYKDVETKVSYKVSCSKGDENTPGGCSGAAIIFMTIEEMVIDEKVNQDINENIIARHILVTSLLERLRDSFYSAAAHISICLKTLLNNVKEAEQSQNVVKRDKLCQIGNSLFYYLMECFDDEINSFQPTKIFLAEQLHFLCKEFIQGESQGMQLLESLTVHPYVESLLTVVDLFNPMAHSEEYVEMYMCLVEKIDVLPLNVVSTLIKKFDISAWLQSSKRMFSKRTKLIHVLGRALCKIGQQLNGMEQIYEVYDNHFSVLLIYNFPEHYSEILNMLLNGSDTLSLPKEAWTTFLRSLGLILPSETAVDNKEIIEQYATKQKFVLSAKQAAETLVLIGEHFQNKLELYEKYGYYIPSLVNVLIVMSHVYIHNALFDITGNENELIDELWETIKGAFSPWLHPTERRSPWSASNTDFADLLFKSYIMCIDYLEKKVNDSLQGASILSVIWRYYAETYSQTFVKEYVRATAQKHLSSLKWNEFSPELKDVQLMIQLVESQIPDNVNFVSSIFVKIPWTNRNYLFGGVNETFDTEILPVLTNLIIKLAWEPAVTEAGTLPQILRSAEECSWHLVNNEIIALVVNTFVEKCNPQCILQEKQHGSLDAILLRFLRIITCMEPQELLRKYPHTLQHRLLYMKTCVFLLIECSIANPEILKEKKNMYLKTIHNIMQQIDSSTMYNVLPSDRFKQTVKMIGQFFDILSAPQAELRDIVMVGVTTWFEEKPNNYLILPCIQASCKSINCMQYLVEIVECCIAKYFYTNSETAYVLRYLSIPEPCEDDFLAVCSKENMHLSQYIYIEQKLLECKSQDHVNLLNMLVNWNEEAIPQQSTEAKLILLWDKILTLSLKQIDADNELGARKLLDKFIKKLASFGKEDSTLLFLSRAPYQVTTRFRFLSRFVASFVAVQIPMNGPIRTGKYAAGHIAYNGATSPTAKEKTFSGEKCKPNPSAKELVDQLQSLLKWRKYASIKNCVEEAINAVMDADHHLRDIRTLLKQFTIKLYDTRSNRFLELLNQTEPEKAKLPN